MTDDQTLRRDCLDMAIRSGLGSCGEKAVLVGARAYFDYIRGTNDAEVLRAARDLAAKVAQGAGT